MKDLFDALFATYNVQFQGSGAIILFWVATILGLIFNSTPLFLIAVLLFVTDTFGVKRPKP